jgi:hypothetical protein
MVLAGFAETAKWIWLEQEGLFADTKALASEKASRDR